MLYVFVLIIFVRINYNLHLYDVICLYEWHRFKSVPIVFTIVTFIDFKAGLAITLKLKINHSAIFSSPVLKHRARHHVLSFGFSSHYGAITPPNFIL